MGGHVSSRGDRPTARMSRPRTNTPGPHGLTHFDGICYPKVEEYTRIWSTRGELS